MHNFFTFNQKLHFCKRELLFVEEFIAKYWAVRFAEEHLNGHDATTSRAIIGPRSHDAGSTSLSFPPFDLHWSVHRQPCITPLFIDCEIKSQSLDFTNSIDCSKLSKCF